MFLTGISDEAAPQLERQIDAIRALGWETFEARNINGKNLHDLDDAAFETVVDALAAAGLRVHAFASTIGNWASPITAPFEDTLAVVGRAIPRMQRLGATMVRVMSFAVRKESDDQMEEERFRRMREITARFLDAGITPVHENCMNYGGMGWEYTLRLLENVPGLRLVFDTGNPVFTPDYAKGEPYPRQSAWAFYTHVKDHIEYVHIKDGIWDEGRQDITYTYPGEGQGDVRRVLTDLFANGYDGGISIEPHMAVVFHEDKATTDADAAKPDPYKTFLEYGRRMARIIKECRPSA